MCKGSKNYITEVLQRGNHFVAAYTLYNFPAYVTTFILKYRKNASRHPFSYNSEEAPNKLAFFKSEEIIFV